MSVSLGELAVRFGCTLKGDPDRRVTHVASIEDAGPDAVTFLANPRFRRHLAAARAGVIILDPKLAERAPGAALLSSNPYATYARIAQLLHPLPAVQPGRHPSAVIDPDAVVDASAWIGPNTVIEAGVRIGARVAVGPGSVVMRDVVIGADTRLIANVTICHGAVIGARCTLSPGVVIGADGFGFAPDKGGYVKVPQLGSVQLGDDVDVGANTTIDRGAIGDTVIGNGVKLDNQIQIGHNVRIGEHTVMAGCSGISGSTVVGAHCMIGGMVGIAGHLTICDGVLLTGKSFVSSSIRQPGYYSSGLPVEESAKFRKNAARFYQLDELARDVRRLRGEAKRSHTEDIEHTEQSEHRTDDSD